MEQNFKIAVPEGCTASIEQKDGFLIISFDPVKNEEWIPENGDIVTDTYGAIYIFKEMVTKPYSGKLMAFYCRLYGSSTSVGLGNIAIRSKHIRPATDKERQRLFDALAKEGKRWNAETKQIEDLPRWRAKRGEEYYCVKINSDVLFFIENFGEADNNVYAKGNYFKTQEAAENVAEQIKEIFKNSKAE